MLADFPVLYVDAIVRRTLALAIALGVAAVALSSFLGQYLAGIGVVLGLAGATANHRLFQLSTARYSDAEGHLERKPYFGSVVGRLGALTVVAFALLYFVRPMGFGMVGGLVAFQFLLMANALGALWRYQRAQLSAPPAVQGQPRGAATMPAGEAPRAARGPTATGTRAVGGSGAKGA